MILFNCSSVEKNIKNCLNDSLRNKFSEHKDYDIWKELGHYEESLVQKKLLSNKNQDSYLKLFNLIKNHKITKRISFEYSNRPKDTNFKDVL